MTSKTRPVMVAGILLALVALILPAQFAVGQDKSANKSIPPASGKKTTVKGSAKGSTTNPFPKRVAAPALDGGIEWLNTSSEITLQDLRGKIVLLDFWTYCCINCMHILPDLKYLEKKYPNELVVIGVHSGKFLNEKDSTNIRNAILRYEIKHPVINDANMKVWSKFLVNTWPTFVLIDPEGNFCGVLSGEGNRENLDTAISRLIAYHRTKGTLDESPPHFDLEENRAKNTPLRYPGKIFADEKGQRLFISDSNHNRIVVTNLAGKFLFAIGSGVSGSKDGDFNSAQFDHPQGMDLNKNKLYVADTENHMIRVVDLDQKNVKTIAGNGKQSRQFHNGGKALQVGLASPWDVKKIGDKLYIAMAGFHQIWVLHANDLIRPFAGSGKEDVQNGSLKASAFAQPSGICSDGENLYVVDSEGSAVRKIGVKSGGQVTTLVGTNDLPDAHSLFEFGDIDGIGNRARLQHPLGIIYDNGRLLVADTYNHKIKVVDIAQRSSMTLLPPGSGSAIHQTTVSVPVLPPSSNSESQTRELFEPGGLSIAGHKLYIADTNNHRIRVYDQQNRQFSTLELQGVTPPASATDEDSQLVKNAVKAPAQTVAAGENLEFAVTLSVPEGCKLNPDAPVTWILRETKKQKLISEEHLKQRDEATLEDSRVTIQVPLAGGTGSGEFQLTVNYLYCKEEQSGGLCKLKSASWIIPITVAKTGEKSIALEVAED